MTPSSSRRCPKRTSVSGKEAALPGAEPPLLLDTHAFVWAALSPERLPEPAALAMRDAGRTLLLSAASVWEISIKLGRGRWQEARPLLLDLEDVLRSMAIRMLPIGLEHARSAGLLDWEHRDPFDRMLAAQAIAEGACLVTADPAFGTLPASAGLTRMWQAG